MFTKIQALLGRCARWLLGCALRYWPEETRPWGMALAAEIDETANAFETVRWSLGGIMFFGGSVLSSAWKWLRLPVGVPLPGGDGGGPVVRLFPRRSRLFTAGVLTVVALLLLLPECRDAISTVRASWTDFQQSPSDQRALEKLAAHAEKENDAATLAFVALSMNDPEGTPELSRRRFKALADRAVLLNPQFVWIYGGETHWPTYVPAAEGTLERLQASDPGNAVPDLLAADALVESRTRAISDRRPLTNAEIETLLSGDSKWMSLMERPFTAPRYDSYFQRHYELTRDVWNRERYLSPTVVLSGLRYHAIPNMLNMRSFSEFKIHEAQKAFVAHDLRQAESLLNEVDAFGDRMVSGSETKLEKLIGMSLAQNASRELSALYASEGNAENAQRFHVRVQQFDERFRGMWQGSDPESIARAQTFRKLGIMMQVLGSLAIIAAFAALTGIMLLELWPARFSNQKKLGWRGLCWAADFAPATLLVASGAFLLSFLPFARALAEYRSSSHVVYDLVPIEEALWSLVAVPRYLNSAVGGVAIWASVTGLLAALAVFIVAGSFYRARRVQAKHI